MRGTKGEGGGREGVIEGVREGELEYAAIERFARLFSGGGDRLLYWGFSCHIDRITKVRCR